MKTILNIGISFLIIFGSGCAMQKDVIYIDDRVDAIEKKMSKYKLASGDTDKALRAEYARINNQLDTINEKFLRLQGQFEEIEYAVNSQRETISKIVSKGGKTSNSLRKLLRRIKQLESYTGYEATDDNEVVKNRAERPVKKQTSLTKKSDDIVMYVKAKKAFDKDQLKTARGLFTKLLKKYPGSDKADNAQFWIAESYYRGKWYQKAILEYQKVIEDFPKGNKIAAAYLKQGLAFAALGERDNSRLVLNDLVKKYPGSKEASIAKKKLKKISN